ncbi:MAG TPA: hypothetical protein VFB60_09730 [Ktedonobacteraceae bacterium]|nr:hypothetical protein [Ktedonobacteraceae bacterium]
MTQQQVSWGNVTLILDNEAFRKAFYLARQWYFADIYGEQGRPPEEPQRSTILSSEDVLRLVITPDAQGHYHFDEMETINLPESLGYLIGYLSGPLAPEEAVQYWSEQAQHHELRSSVPV